MVFVCKEYNDMNEICVWVGFGLDRHDPNAVDKRKDAMVSRRLFIEPSIWVWKEGEGLELRISGRTNARATAEEAQRRASRHTGSKLSPTPQYRTPRQYSHRKYQHRRYEPKYSRHLVHPVDLSSEAL
jgi:hypothetical protein